MSTEESRKLEKKLAHLRDIKRRDAVREIYGGKPAPPPTEDSEEEDTAL
jgi:hypothetical protein